jgi:hypothetical protein
LPTASRSNSPTNATPHRTSKTGYYIAPNENIGFFAELMNMVDTPRAAYITMTFEFIPGMPSGFSQAQSMWLDIGGCGSSSLPAKAHTHFDYSSPKWTVPSGLSGKVTFVAGHLHDGGTRLEVVRNGDVVCVSKAEYGCEGAELEPRQGHDDPAEGMPRMNMSSMHITHMTSCENAARVEKGDQWSVAAHYNTALHEPMVVADGSLEPIMGIALVYVAEEELGSEGLARS